MQLPCSSLAHLSTNSCETGSFSHWGNIIHSQLWVSPLKGKPLSQPLPHSLLPPINQPCLHGLLPCLGLSPYAALPVWLFCLTVSLIPWLSEFHAVWFSGTSGCLLILDWWLSSFWLWEEMKGFYLCLCLGRHHTHSYKPTSTASLMRLPWFLVLCEIGSHFCPLTSHIF